MATPNLPGASVSIKDGAFGAIQALGDLLALVGVSTGGTPETVYQFSDIPTLVATLGGGPTGGPLVEAAAEVIARSRRPVICIPVDPSTAGSVGSVTVSSGGLDPGASFTGTPKDGYAIRVKITKAGAVGTARFRIAFDGDNPDGPTYSDEIVTAATYALGPLAGTGLTIAFAAGTYVLGSVYSATCTAPSFSASDMTDALAALALSDASWRGVFVVGEASSAANGAAAASALDTWLTAQETGARYCWGAIQAPSDTDANLQAAYSSFSTKRVVVGAGFCTLTSQLSGRGFTRGAIWPAVAWAMKLRISQDLGELAEGDLDGVTALARDERKTPGLDASGFLTLRTHVGYRGAYVNNPRIMAPAGSDFELLQFRQVMDVGCATGRASALYYLGKPLLVNSDGTIAELDALAVEARVGAALVEALVNEGHATAASCVVDRTINLLTTKKLKLKLRIRPFGYVKTIEIEIGFEDLQIAA